MGTHPHGAGDVVFLGGCPKIPLCARIKWQITLRTLSVVLTSTPQPKFMDRFTNTYFLFSLTYFMPIAGFKQALSIALKGIKRAGTLASAGVIETVIEFLVVGCKIFPRRTRLLALRARAGSTASRATRRWCCLSPRSTAPTTVSTSRCSPGARRPSPPCSPRTW